MGYAARAVVFVSLLLGPVRPTAADVIAEWNEKAVAAGYRSGVSHPAQSRNMALVHVSMFDAVNAIAPRYTPFHVQLPAGSGASLEAAAAAAAHFVLVRVYPDQEKDFDAALKAALASVPDHRARTRGIEIGRHVAAAILDHRRTDAADAPNTYRPFTTAGTYVPTLFPVAPQWGSVKPFGLETGSQFRPPAPYALASAQWATDYNEVKRLGGKVASQRSTEQTDIARFWELTGPATYYPIVRQLSIAKGLDLLENARLYALVAIAGADSMIAVLDAKYTYNFWRPVTAIRNGDLDGNEGTERDATWEPFISTPMHPEYPCGHCISSSAVASVLEASFGDAVPTFTLSSSTAPEVTRRFNRLSEYVAEVVDARVFDGVHYRTSGEAGAEMGRQIGAYIARNRLRPLPKATVQ